jgi:cell volume regulation protein A
MKRLNLKEKHFRKDHIQSIRTIKIVQFDIAFFIRSFFFVFLGMITDIKLVTFSLVLMTGSLLAIMILTRFFSVQLISFIEQKYRKHAFLVATMMPRGFIATLLAFLPFNEGIIIPHFTEAMFLLIFSASFISIFGTILFGGQRGTIKPNVKESG